MSWVAVGVGAVGLGTSIYKGVKAGQENKKAQREADALKHPFYKVQDEYFQNKNIAAEEATGGLGAGTKDALDIERKRGLSSTLQALKESGAGSAGFDNLLKGFNESTNQEASADSQAHVQNIQYFMQANKDLAGQKNTGFGINELQPFENKLAEITQRRAAAKQNEQAAIEEGIGTIGTTLSTVSNNNYMDKLFGKKDPYSLPSDGKQYATSNAGSGGVTNFADTQGKLSTEAPPLEFTNQEEQQPSLPDASQYE